LPLKILTERFFLCAEASLNQLKLRNQNKNKFTVEENEVRSFIVNSISTSIFGDECVEAHEIVKQIDEDFNKFEASFKALLSSIMPNVFSLRVLREDVCAFFKDKVSCEVSRRRANKAKNSKDVLQTFIDELSKHSLHEDFIGAQIFTFYAGG
jgi:hypothetical protein